MKQIIIATIFICAYGFSVFAQTENVCPTVSVSSPPGEYQPGRPREFSVQVIPAEKYDLKYGWTISSGKIVSGLGSKTITVISNATDLTATVEIGGLPEQCGKVVVSEGIIYEPPMSVKQDAFDRFGQSGTKARLDDFFLELSKDKTVEGVIVFPNDNELLRRVRMLRDHIAFRQFPAARLTIVISADNAPGPTEFWRVPSYLGMDHWKDELKIKLEDFEELQKIFQPVKRKAKK